MPETTPIVFIDTETTGVHPDRRPWEIAMIRRDEKGDRETLIQVTNVDLSNADPFGLKVGRFYDRHCKYRFDYEAQVPTPSGEIDEIWRVEYDAAVVVERITRGAHLVGAVPNFDAETLGAMLRRHKLIPAWHYHLVDVEALAVGWMLGRSDYVVEGVPLPWKSDEISKAVGVDPTWYDRHTALGDAKWARAIYDAVTGGPHA